MLTRFQRDTDTRNTVGVPSVVVLAVEVPSIGVPVVSRAKMHAMDFFYISVIYLASDVEELAYNFFV
jgi:hypothetical protein